MVNSVRTYNSRRYEEEKPKKPVDFFIRPFIETLLIMKSKLSGAALRFMEFLSASSTFHDEVVFLPSAKQIAEILDMGLSTVYTCLKKIEGLEFLRFHTTSQFIIAYRTDPDNPKNFFDFQNQESFPVQKNHFQKFRNDSQNVENQQLELLPDKAFNSLQTIHKDHTTQTGGKVDEKVNKEELPEEIVEEEINKQEEEIVEQQEEKEDKYTVLPNHELKKKIPPGATQKEYEMLLEKLRMFDIKTSEQVLVKISQHHISQAYGAVAHIENTFETIRDKTAVFLYQLPKQPIEKLGQRHTNESLEKQKQDLKLIEEEIKQGRKSLSDMTGFSRIKQKLANRTEKRPKN